MKSNKPQKIDWVNTSKFIKCDCYGHLLEICREKEIVDNKVTFQNFNLSFWEWGTSTRPLSFRERIRWCWNLLRKGQPWSDHVILSDKKAKKLAQFILTEINKKKSVK